MACFFYFVLITIVSMATASRNKAAFKNNDWHNPAQTPCSFQQELNNKTATDLCINAFNKASQLMQHQNWPVEYPLLNETHLCDDQYPCLNGLQTGLMAGITNLYLRNERDSSDVTIAVIATALLALSCIAVQLYQSKCVQSRSDRSTPPLMQINA